MDKRDKTRELFNEAIGMKKALKESQEMGASVRSQLCLTDLQRIEDLLLDEKITKSDLAAQIKNLYFNFIMDYFEVHRALEGWERDVLFCRQRTEVPEESLSRLDMALVLIAVKVLKKKLDQLYQMFAELSADTPEMEDIFKYVLKS